jgi:thiol-disulfide isomerase/thioredoxin
MRNMWSAVVAGMLLTAPVGVVRLTAAPTARGAKQPLVAVDSASLRQKLAALRGKVVVLNMWATWCGPCVHEFPDIVKLDRAYRGRGVAVIGLSMDDPQTARQRVPPFLAQQRATFPIYILKPGSAEATVRVVDRYWSGAIPMTYVFDRSGRLQARFTGARTFDAFEAAIKPLLRSPAAGG